MKKYSYLESVHKTVSYSVGNGKKGEGTYGLKLNALIVKTIISHLQLDKHLYTGTEYLQCDVNMAPLGFP